VQPVATCRQSPYVHKPAIVKLLLLIYSFQFRSVSVQRPRPASHAHFGHRQPCGLNSSIDIFFRSGVYNIAYGLLMHFVTCFGCLPARPYKTRSPLKFGGVPQTPEPISPVSAPKFTILSGHVEEALLLNKFFRLSIYALVAKMLADKVVRRCPGGEFLAISASCIFSEPRATHFRPAF